MKRLWQTNRMVSPLCVGLVWLGLLAAVVGQSRPNSRQQGETNAKAGRANLSAAAREEAVFAFVKKHHPELTGLLRTLKAAGRAEYQRAMRELNRTRERLVRVRETDEARYADELATWKLQSRAHLLAARFKMSGDEKYRKQLAAVLEEKAELKAKMARRVLTRQRARLKRLEQQYDKLLANRDQALKRELNVLTRGNRKQATTRGKADASPKTDDRANKAKK